MDEKVIYSCVDQVHDIHLCTGFVGDITQYIRNWMRHHGGKAET